jgi:citrate synthase
MSQIGQAGAPVTHISQAYADRVEVRGRDLCGDLMGRLSFTDYFHLLLTGSEPTNDQRFFSRPAARLTSAPSGFSSSRTHGE